MATPKIIHKTREQWLAAFTDACRPKFKEIGSPLPRTVRASIGFCSTGQRGKRAGECWSIESSKDGISEIFIMPSYQSSPKMLASIMVHELVHAAVGLAAGHGPIFLRAARKLGHEGKAKSVFEGKEFDAWTQPIIKALGRFPGADLEGSTTMRKKQTTRMIKLTCVDCSWSCRTTRPHIDASPVLCCPTVSCEGYLEEA